MPVEVIGTEIEHRGRPGVEAVGAGQLEAGQFEDIQFHPRLGQQVQRRDAQVAAHRHRDAGPGGHRA